MQLGETIATYDVAMALRGESGKFVVTSPGGEIYDLTCELHHSIINLQSSGNGSNPQPFLIQKVAEPVRVAGKTPTDLTETPKPVDGAKAPFLVGGDTSGLRAENGAPQPVKPGPSQTGPENESVSNLDLLCAEVGLEPTQETVWVCLRGEAQHDRGKMVTSACTSFNEFDAEIRRLHAQLDDIRCRARKKFYQAQVIATGA
jgi:hypothetical protein